MIEPLKITAHLLDGRIASTDLMLPLDSLLAWAWIAKHRPELLNVTMADYSNVFQPPLPLDRIETEGTWYYACSFACADPKAEIRSYWNKRFDATEAEQAVDFGKWKAKVNKQAGLYRGHHSPLCIFLLPKLEWYARGNRAEVESLLSSITHLGKKRSQGYGLVREWEVEIWPQDLSWLRPVPNPDGDEIMGVHAPYWLIQDHVRVSWPNDNGKLAARKILAS